MSQPLLSVVITVYNEEENIKPLLDATYAALSERGHGLLHGSTIVGTPFQSLVVIELDN
jgi:glycosyltransferase involved in cell wall biosynthesis